MSPSVSVVMSVFNGAETIAETLDSLLAQTASDFEIVVVDDGSTDDTADILDDYHRRDSRIHVIRQGNTGLTRALIAGCAAASGRYIARQDAGDISLSARLQLQQRMLDTDAEVTLVSSWTNFIGPGHEPLYEVRGRNVGRATRVIDLSLEHGLTDGPTHHGSVMFRRDLYERVGGYRPEFYYGQDWDLWYRLLEQGTYVVVPEVLYLARITPDSISTSARPEQEELAALSFEALRLRSEGMSDAAVLERAAAVHPVRRGAPAGPAQGLYFIGESLRRNGNRRAVLYLMRAVMAAPWLLKGWVRLVQALTLPTGDER